MSNPPPPGDEAARVRAKILAGLAEEDGTRRVYVRGGPIETLCLVDELRAALSPAAPASSGTPEAIDLARYEWTGAISRVTGYGIRRCRGHFHVTNCGNDLASIFPNDDPFIKATYDDINEALDVADKLNALRSAPLSASEPPVDPFTVGNDGLDAAPAHLKHGIDLLTVRALRSVVFGNLGREARGVVSAAEIAQVVHCVLANLRQAGFLALSAEARTPEPGQGTPPDCKHELKVWPTYFAAILDGSKPFEWREEREGRHFWVDDTLLLRELEHDRDSAYTGRWLVRRVSYVLRGQFNMPGGYVVLGLSVEPQQ